VIILCPELHQISLQPSRFEKKIPEEIPLDPWGVKGRGKGIKELLPPKEGKVRERRDDGQEGR